MEYLATIIGGFAVVISLLSYRFSRSVAERNAILAEKNDRLERAVFYLERNSSFEGKLFECPEALALMGVDLEEAEREGVSPSLIAYMVMNMNAAISYCTATGRKLEDHIRDSRYRRRLFKQDISRRTWKYARLFSVDAFEKIDIYLKEEYDVVYDKLNP